MASKVGTRGAVHHIVCVVFPLRTVISGPFMMRACFASLGVTGQFLMRFLLIKMLESNSVSSGHPILR